MRFEFYHSELERVPKLSVDGTVSHSIHLSHWEGNKTPVKLKADTSTEIALNFVAAPDSKELGRGIDLVTNNHFDTDGVFSVWTMLNGQRALELRDKLIPAAEAGDFSEFTTPDAVRASIAIQGADQASPNDETGSPLARFLAGEQIDDEGKAYELVLPEVENVLTRTDRYEGLWRNAWDRIEKAIESFERGGSMVEEFPGALLSLVILAPEVFTQAGFNPTRHAPPYTAISRYANGLLFLIATPRDNGWIYRIDYPYYSWAETVVRPRIKRHDWSPTITRLNELEKNDSSSWVLSNSEMTSAAKFLGRDGALAISQLPPDEVARALIDQLSFEASSAAS